jgi:hypothetical protein
VGLRLLLLLLRYLQLLSLLLLLLLLLPRLLLLLRLLLLPLLRLLLLVSSGSLHRYGLRGAASSIKGRLQAGSSCSCSPCCWRISCWLRRGRRLLLLSRSRCLLHAGVLVLGQAAAPAAGIHPLMLLLPFLLLLPSALLLLAAGHRTGLLHCHGLSTLLLLLSTALLTVLLERTILLLLLLSTALLTVLLERTILLLLLLLLLLAQRRAGLLLDHQPQLLRVAAAWGRPAADQVAVVHRCVGCRPQDQVRQRSLLLAQQQQHRLAHVGHRHPLAACGLRRGMGGGMGHQRAALRA